MRYLQKFLQKPWLYLFVILIGVSLKFYRVDYRYFWYDEIATIYHTSGNQIYNSPVNEIKNIVFFKEQLRLKTQNHTLGSQLKGLYGSTNLNPLHYTFLMVWYRIAGDSDMSYRYFNIFIFILTLPVLFLLARSLFKSNLAGWIIISLYVLSPYFHFYAHEARYNIFSVFLIVLLHYFFLQAIEFKNLKWWFGYSLVGILALYASVMSGIVLFGHVIYVLFFKKDIRIVYSVNLLIILSCYLPWIISMINNSTEITESLAWHFWYGKGQNFLKLIQFQFFGFAHIFTNLSDAFAYICASRAFNFTGVYIQLIADIIIFFIILLSVVYTIKKAPAKVALFLVLIVLPHILFYFISDLIRNTGGSSIWRYHAINYVGVLLFVACFLNGKIASGKLLFSGIYLSLVIAGFISILFISKDKCFYVPLNCEQNINEAEIFSDAEHSLLISDYSMRHGIGTGGFFTILNRCESDNIDVLHASPGIENVEEMIAGRDYSEIYVTHASGELVQNLKSQFGERMDSLEIEGIDPMWQIKP